MKDLLFWSYIRFSWLAPELAVRPDALEGASGCGRPEGSGAFSLLRADAEDMCSCAVSDRSMMGLAARENGNAVEVGCEPSCASC